MKLAYLVGHVTLGDYGLQKNRLTTSETLLFIEPESPSSAYLYLFSLLYNSRSSYGGSRSKNQLPSCLFSCLLNKLMNRSFDQITKSIKWLTSRIS
jgi:hypothetical protein